MVLVRDGAAAALRHVNASADAAALDGVALFGAQDAGSTVFFDVHFTLAWSERDDDGWSQLVEEWAASGNDAIVTFASTLFTDKLRAGTDIFNITENAEGDFKGDDDDDTVSCPAESCFGTSCDDWAATDAYTCAQLEVQYGCFCTGCDCKDSNATTTALFRPHRVRPATSPDRKVAPSPRLRGAAADAPARESPPLRTGGGGGDYRGRLGDRRGGSSHARAPRMLKRPRPRAAASSRSFENHGDGSGGGEAAEDTTATTGAATSGPRGREARLARLIDAAAAAEAAASSTRSPRFPRAARSPRPRRRAAEAHDDAGHAAKPMIDRREPFVQPIPPVLELVTITLAT